jgi:hypothetical protein
MRDEKFFGAFAFSLLTELTLHHSGLNTMRWTARRGSVDSNSSNRAFSIAEIAASFVIPSNH